MHTAKPPQTPPSPTLDAPPRTVLARELFRGGPVLRIVHGDQVYLLRRTRENRLILTK